MLKKMPRKNRADEISALENKYGPYFNMALAHLFDVGYLNITPEAVEEAKIEIQNEEQCQEGIPIMTAGFKCQLLDIALELKQFSIWELLSYVKTDLFIG